MKWHELQSKVLTAADQKVEPRRELIFTGFPGSSDGKEAACNAADLGCEDSLEEGMATQSSVLAWRIPWTEEPGGLQSMESQRVGHNWATKHNKHAPQTRDHTLTIRVYYPTWPQSPLRWALFPLLLMMNLRFREGKKLSQVTKQIRRAVIQTLFWFQSLRSSWDFTPL